MNPFKIIYAMAVLLFISIKFHKDIEEEYLCRNNLIPDELT